MIILLLYYPNSPFSLSLLLILILQVCPLSDDTTYIKAYGSADPSWQGAFYSGKRGHGHCLLVGHLVDPLGRVIAVRPGTGILLFCLFSKSCSYSYLHSYSNN